MLLNSQVQIFVHHAQPQPKIACGNKYGNMFTGVRGGGLMVGALDSRLNGPDQSPGLGHCVVSLSKALNCHSESLHPGV